MNARGIKHILAQMHKLLQVNCMNARGKLKILAQMHWVLQVKTVAILATDALGVARGKNKC